MAKFKSLNIGDTVRVVSLADTEDRCGFDKDMRDTVGDVSEITALGRQYMTDLGRVKLANGWWYSPKGLEVVEGTGDDKGEFVTPDTPVGTRVVYVGRATRSFEVGTVFTLTRHDGDNHPRVDYEDKEDWEYIHYDDLRVCKDSVDASDDVRVTADTPVGTTVVYIGGDDGTHAPIGVPLELKRHDGDDRPLVEVIGSTDLSDYYYPDYKYLRVHVDGTDSTSEPTEPTPEPVESKPELTNADFKYTRVRVKDTGAEGVVVGRSESGRIAVLHDATSGYHGGTLFAVGFVGVPDRIYYYQATELDIIGGVQ